MWRKQRKLGRRQNIANFLLYVESRFNIYTYIWYKTGRRILTEMRGTSRMRQDNGGSIGGDLEEDTMIHTYLKCHDEAHYSAC